LLGASPDNKQSNISICQIAQGGLGLPDRDYYFDEDKEDKRIAYKTHIAKMLSLLQNNTNDNDDNVEDTFIKISNDIFDLETKLAKGHMTKTENRDPESTYNKMSIHELSSSTYSDPKFPFPAFFTAATNKTMDELGHVNIRNLQAIQIATTLITSIDHDVLKHYLRWRSIRSCAQYLNKAFVNEDFNFNEKILAGTNEIKPRWKRAMAFTENALGEALGQMYCAKYFDESCKQKALFIVESVRQALEDRLKEVDWIQSDSTREEALKKMSRFNVKIGYPDKWIDYSTLDIQSNDSFMMMIFKSRVFDHEREVKEMNAPTDRNKWFMTPQTVNAYYHPNLNEIVFPAAILQAPFFDPTADDAINFGSMGAVVGK
jgi:putative endopeptidase